MTDYKVKYNIPDNPLPDQSIYSENQVEFIIIAPESIEEEQLYYNAINYGYIGHLGIRMNPLKLSFGLSYSTRQLEPDSQIFDLFYENPDHIYNLTGMVTLSWFFEAKR